MVILLGSIGIISCKKETIANEPPYIEQWWDEYYGNYTVFDTANDFTYELEILQKSRFFDGKFFSDSVEIKNLINHFNICIYQQAIIAEHLSFGVLNPITDKYGARWAFSGNAYWSGNKDTLKIVYTLSNILYYMEDGVPYYGCECVDLAVKNE